MISWGSDLKAVKWHFRYFTEILSRFSWVNVSFMKEKNIPQFEIPEEWKRNWRKTNLVFQGKALRWICYLRCKNVVRIVRSFLYRGVLQGCTEKRRWFTAETQQVTQGWITKTRSIVEHVSKIIMQAYSRGECYKKKQKKLLNIQIMNWNVNVICLLE